MTYCLYCSNPCQAYGFCDETCKSEYDNDLRVFQDSISEDYPGESRYAGEFGEIEEWDVEGGL